MVWPWLSCLLLPALMVSGGYLPSPTRATLTWGSSAEPYGPAPGLAALGRPGEESSPGPVSWTESWPVGLVWAPTGADGGQSLWRCPDVPTLCVPTVSANVAPKFLSNMSLVNLPEDLPVGE